MSKIYRLDEAMVYGQNGLVVAIAILVQQLEKNGALDKGEYREALRNTINQATCEPGRPDCGLLVHLGNYLDGKFDDMPAVQ